MLELLSDKSVPIELLADPGNGDSGDTRSLVLENADKTIAMRTVTRTDFQVARVDMRFMTKGRLVFSNPEAPYVLLFVLNYSLRLLLPSLVEREMHDRAAQLIFLPRGRFTLEFQKSRNYQLLMVFYTGGFIKNLESEAGPFWAGRKGGAAALFFHRSVISSKFTIETVSTGMTAPEHLADGDKSLGAAVLSALLDFTLSKVNRFQPAQLSAAQLEGFYAERDRLLLLATRTMSFSRLLTLAEIRDRPLFRKRMNQLYGLNIRDFIIETRMEKAKSLLGDFELSIKQIAGLTGFKNPFYFSRVFSRYFGRSPKSFRSGLSE